VIGFEGGENAFLARIHFFVSGSLRISSKNAIKLAKSTREKTTNELFQDISKAFQYSNVLVSGLIEGSAFQQR
jgi:hypothetical protein